jgi:hypothetical protein
MKNDVRQTGSEPNLNFNTDPLKSAKIRYMRYYYDFIGRPAAVIV